MMWIGRMGALVTKPPGVVNGFVGVSEKGRGFKRSPGWGRRAGFPARLGFQDLAIRPKPGSQPNGAR